MARKYRGASVTFDSLRRALEASWGSDTSASPEKWSTENAAYGQCAVTALIVQDFLGGRLLRVEAFSKDEKVSHYYNELPDLKVVDLTRSQFPEGTLFSDPGYRERAYVESFASTVKRYKILKGRVDLALSKRQ